MVFHLFFVLAVNHSYFHLSWEFQKVGLVGLELLFADLNQRYSDHSDEN